ncbi:MAG: NAD(P)H-dependent oxidoreductase, partial [Actinocatenispora sp.]
MQPLKIAIIVGSTRPRRRSPAVADWVHRLGTGHARDTGSPVTYRVVDLAEYSLPMLDEAVPAAIGAYDNPHTERWAATIDEYDGFVFVTPEYNHS